MKTRYLLFTVQLFAFSIAVSAQKPDLFLRLKDGAAKTTTISVAGLDSFDKHTLRLKNKTIAVVQFETLPTEAARKDLAANGMELLDYIPQNAYTVSITGKLNAAVLQKWRAQTFLQLAPKQKMHPALAKGQLPGWAVKVPGTINVQVQFPKTFATLDIIAALKEKGMDVVATSLSSYHVLSVRLAADRLQELAALPFVLFVQPELPKDQPLNYFSRIASRSSVLNTTVADGGRGLDGTGIVMGIGDNADVQFHADFSGRLINRTSSTASAHGTHVHGTAAGAGIINEQYRGYAPKATIVSENFNGILADAPVYVQDYGMVITNNSYGVVSGCGYNGGYDMYSYILDQQAFDYPYLQHVFAAGNSGQSVCAPYPAGFHTVLGSYQTAKNVLCVGNADYNGVIAASSSKGPVNDGRIKPEISAMGEAVYSSVPTNNYGYNWGTSMASPAVSGGLALLYQRYRQLNGNANPKSGLIKALVCNGATDKGLPGPDYSYGFGFMNLERSITILEGGKYFTSTVTNGATKTHTITVPANSAQLKVMLYWHDPASNFLSSQDLVNDLDLKVINPSAVTTFPKILNPSPAGVTTAAVEGPDHINNIEQVVIDNPAAGTYSIKVFGSVAQNPSQEYYVVYDVVPTDLRLVFPAAGTVLTPGEQTSIAWDSYGGPANMFSLEYSTDNGTNWNPISSTINPATRSYTWTAPPQTSDQVLVTVKKNGTSLLRTSGAFTVIGTPTVSLASTQCEGYININWTAVSGATDYQVMLLRGSDMVPVATTTATSYSFSSLSKDSVYWVGVRARLNGKPGRRSISISRQPNSGTCSGTISDNDLKLAAIVAPVSGRKFTSSTLTTAAVKVDIKNLDDAAATNFTVGYRINSGAWVFENVSTTIAAGNVYTHTFSTTENFSATGLYTLTAVVKNTAADAAVINDTLVRIIKHLDNQPINLATTFLNDMEAASVATYTTDTIGLQNIDRYDFTPATYGRLRTFINSGVALAGAKSLAIDVDRKLTTTPSPAHYLTGTFNLSSYNAAVNDIRLQFNSLDGSDGSSTENNVWIRGNDTQPWVQVLTPVGSGTSPSIEVGNLLNAQGQNFSSSFQVRWGVPSSGPIVSQSVLEGLLLDNVQLYQVFNDVQLLRIDTPYALNCGLSNVVPVAVTVRNSSNTTLTNVPVRYAINNGAWVSEIIASIPARTAVQYTFTTKANLSVAGVYDLTAEVVYPTDTYSANNAATVTIYNSATITSFPHLQDFESSDGGWYTDGYNTSWEYGTPASVKISRAASGAKAWKTTLNGNYNDDELSYLYSPCYTIAGMTKPTISFSVALDLENCGASMCDGAWLEYSTDNINWYNLADVGNAGTNWYTSPLQVWNTENNTAWHVATMKLPTGVPTIRFRFVLRSDAAVNREGLAIDDIHIYDNLKGIYDGTTTFTPITRGGVSGNGWFDFESNGQLIASVLPNNQTMGTTDVQVYINSGAVRYTGNNQYYHDRNISIKPTNQNLAGPATVRLYFLDSEANALINATGCSGCSKPASAYELGVTKYSAVNTTYENGTLSDNTNPGTWSFIPSGSVKKVPFDKGYYAEFQVQNFSEFWLNNGSFDNNTPLPVHIRSFTARREAENVVLRWAADEQAVSHYEIELARGNTAFENNNFQKIGSVESSGNNSAHTYLFSDAEPFKTGVRYYRLKIIDNDGAFRYSEVRSVVFSDAATWQVFPNPSHGVFHFVYQATAADVLQAQVQDANGKMVATFDLRATGFLQKQIVDLTGRPAGVYLLQIRHHGAVHSYKLYKQ